MNSSRTTFRQRLIDLAVRWRMLLLPAAMLLLVASWPKAQELELDRSIESLYSADDPRLIEYQRSKRLFGGDEFAIVAYTDAQLIDETTGEISEPAARRVRDLARRINAIEGVEPESTQDLASLTQRTKDVVDRRVEELQSSKSLLTRLKAPVLRRFRPEGVRKVYQQVEGLLLGADRTTTAVVSRLTREDELPPGVTRGDAIAAIRRAAEEFGAEHSSALSDPYIAVVGEPIQVHDMFEYVDEDGATMFLWSLASLSVVILFLFRSLRWVLLPVLVVATTIVWTEALLVLSGIQLSMVSSMMNSLVTIIGVATVTHVTVHFRGLRRELERTEALKQTLHDLAPAIFWTCATTAVGFGSLLSSEITPVRSFGLMMATATMIVLAVVAFCLPGVVLLGRFDADPRFAPAETQLAGLLSLTARTVRRRPWFFSFAMLGLFAVFAAGLTRLDVETDFSKNFRESSPIVQSLDVVETKLGGAGTWEVNFPAPKHLEQADERDVERYLARVRSLTAALRKEFVGGDSEVTKVVALTDAVDVLPGVAFGDLKDRLRTVHALQPEFIPSLYDPETGRMRIVLRANERRQSAEKLQLIQRVQQVADDWAENELQNYDEDDERYRDPPTVTGLYVVLAFLIDNLLRDQLVSFAWAAGGIFVMLTIAFRSPVLGFLLLLPNLFPIVMVIGGIGWIGLPLNIATAMIASVSMGLTVDFSIHYLAGYRRARARGVPAEQALEETLRSVGRALVFSNLALVVGFSVLTLSHFIPLIYFGILVSVAMIVGLLGDLVLLPLILLWTERITPPQSNRSPESEAQASIKPE